MADPRPLEAMRAAASRINRWGHQLGPETLAVLSADPLAVPTDEMRDIEVLETWIDGGPVRREPSSEPV